MKSLKVASVLCAAWVVAACGGGGAGGGNGVSVAPPPGPVEMAPPPSPPPSPPPEAQGRGSLLVSPPALLQRLAPDEFSLLLEGHPRLKALLAALPAVSGTSAVACGIDLRELEYRTGDEKGGITNANGVIMIPTGASSMCQGPRPVVLYAHGTWFTRDYTFTTLTDPSKPASPEGMLVAAVFASRGYIVVAPNYAGYGKSKLPYHPYLNGDQQSKDVIDALTAARKALPEIGGKDSGKLLVTGVSQGGYVAMAAHRELQATGQPITASAPISAPSAISLLLDHNLQGLTSNGATPFFPLLTTSWQKQFGNLYADPGEIYETRYASGIEALMPSKEPTLGSVFISGKLPRDEIFPESEKPSVANPWYKQHGDANLIRGPYIRAVLDDIKANACPGNAMPPLASLPELSEPFADYRLSGARQLVDLLRTSAGIDLVPIASAGNSVTRYILANDNFIVNSALDLVAPLISAGANAADARKLLLSYAPIIEKIASTAGRGSAIKLPSEEANEPSAAGASAAAPLNCKPQNAVRAAAVANDLRNWTPQRPMLMCGGGLDATVNFRSTLATAAYFRAQGMPDDKLKVIDLEATPAPGDPFAFVHTGFRAMSTLAWQPLSSTTPLEKSRATLDEYHPSLVSPFCLVAARSFFESHSPN